MSFISSILLQVLDLSAVQLVYSSSYFKSLSTGGNVSKALVRTAPDALSLLLMRLNDQPTLKAEKHYATNRSDMS